MFVLRIVWDFIKRQFFSGVFVVVPLILTYVVLRFMFEAVDGILSPLIFKLIKHNIPGLGIIATILIILIAGLASKPGFLIFDIDIVAETTAGWG